MVDILDIDIRWLVDAEMAMRLLLDRQESALLGRDADTAAVTENLQLILDSHIFLGTLEAFRFESWLELHSDFSVRVLGVVECLVHHVALHDLVGTHTLQFSLKLLWRPSDANDSLG